MRNHRLEQKIQSGLWAFARPWQACVPFYLRSFVSLFCWFYDANIWWKVDFYVPCRCVRKVARLVLWKVDSRFVQILGLPSSQTQPVSKLCFFLSRYYHVFHRGLQLLRFFQGFTDFHASVELNTTLFFNWTVSEVWRNFVALNIFSEFEISLSCLFS